MSRVMRQKISDRIVLGKSVIDEAKIGRNVEVIIQDGVILILPAIKKKGWEILKALGKDAVEGVLDNPSENHNQYLYGDRK